jgi:integrase
MNVFEKSLVKFHAGIKSQATRELYDRYLNYFLKFVKIRNSDGLLQLKDTHLQELVEEYAIYLKDRGLRKASVDGRINTLELFFSMNDKILNWKKTRRMSPARLKSLGGDAWNTEEVEKMLNLTSSLRNKAIIHFLASTGCRVGALPELRLRHLSDVGYGCKKIVIYENTTDEYIVFTTPESSKAIDDYLEKRRRDGEYLNPESPLFRNAYQIGIQKTKPMSLMAYRLMFYEIIKKFRGKGKKIGDRYDRAMFHAFRKRVATIMKSNQSANISLVEKLLGHKGAVHLDGAYFHPNDETLFGEFKKHIVNLTIDDSERERLGRLTAEKERDRLVEVQQTDLVEIKGQIQALWKLLEKAKN